MGAKKPTGPRRPNALESFNQGAKNFFGKTKDFITAPFRSSTGSSTPARMTNSPQRRKQPSSGGLLQLPSWLGGGTPPPPQPRTVSEFMGQKRPGFDD